MGKMCSSRHQDTQYLALQCFEESTNKYTPHSGSETPKWDCNCARLFSVGGKSSLGSGLGSSLSRCCCFFYSPTLSLSIAISPTTVCSFGTLAKKLQKMLMNLLILVANQMGLLGFSRSPLESESLFMHSFIQSVQNVTMNRNARARTFCSDISCVSHASLLHFQLWLAAQRVECAKTVRKQVGTATVERARR